MQVLYEVYQMKQGEKIFSREEQWNAFERMLSWSLKKGYITKAQAEELRDFWRKDNP